MYREYKDNKDVAVYFIYVSEAHPKSKPTKEKHIATHKSIEERVTAALKCAKGLKLTVPFLIDRLDYKVQKLYNARPACTTVVDLDGNVAFYAQGPRGTQPEKADAVIKKLLAK